MICKFTMGSGEGNPQFFIRVGSFMGIRFSTSGSPNHVRLPEVLIGMTHILKA